MAPLGVPGAGLSAAPDFDGEQHDLPRVSWRDRHPRGSDCGGFEAVAMMEKHEKDGGFSCGSMV